MIYFHKQLVHDEFSQNVSTIKWIQQMCMVLEYQYHAEV